MSDTERRPNTLGRRLSRREFLENSAYAMGIGGLLTLIVSYVDAKRRLAAANNLVEEGGRELINRPSAVTPDELEEKRSELDFIINRAQSHVDAAEKEKWVVLAGWMATIPGGIAFLHSLVKKK